MGDSPCGKGGARAPRHDDCRHERAHYACHGDPDEIGDVDLGAELLKLDGPDEGQNDSNQERYKRDDGQCRSAAFENHIDKIGAPKAGAPNGQPTE